MKKMKLELHPHRHQKQTTSDPHHHRIHHWEGLISHSIKLMMLVRICPHSHQCTPGEWSITLEGGLDGRGREQCYGFPVSDNALKAKLVLTEMLPLFIQGMKGMACCCIQIMA